MRRQTKVIVVIILCLMAGFGFTHFSKSDTDTQVKRTESQITTMDNGPISWDQFNKENCAPAADVLNALWKKDSGAVFDADVSQQSVITAKGHSKPMTTAEIKPLVARARQDIIAIKRWVDTCGSQVPYQAEAFEMSIRVTKPIIDRIEK